MNLEITQAIASEVQLFQTLDQKENFLFLIGALLARVISLKKASEIMQLEPSEFRPLSSFRSALAIHGIVHLN